MSKIGDASVRFCTSLNDWPAAFLCMFIALLQMAVLDYYLINDLGLDHLTWLGFDAVNITLLGISIYQARGAIRKRREGGSGGGSGSGKLGWITWVTSSAAVAAKTVVIFHYFASSLEEDSGFWGPNTLKTTIALGSVKFLLLLMTQHDAPNGSEGHKYIEELTSTVVFDILDTVDILEVLFDDELRPDLWPGLEEFILAVAVLNLIIPTVPLFTLAKTDFGTRKPSRRLIRWHRILLVLVINVPNLLVRLLLWHGMSAGISPFMLKNIILILMTFYDFYEQEKEDYEDRVDGGEGEFELEHKNGKDARRYAEGKRENSSYPASPYYINGKSDSPSRRDNKRSNSPPEEEISEKSDDRRAPHNGSESDESQRDRKLRLETDSSDVNFTSV